MRKKWDRQVSCSCTWLLGFSGSYPFHDVQQQILTCNLIRNVLGGNFALVAAPSIGASGAIFGTVAVSVQATDRDTRTDYDSGCVDRLVCPLEVHIPASPQGNILPLWNSSTANQRVTARSHDYRTRYWYSSWFHSLYVGAILRCLAGLTLFFSVPQMSITLVSLQLSFVLYLD